MRRPRKTEAPATHGLMLPPYRHEDCWHDYIEGHCKRNGQDFRRVQYVANDWMLVMGRDSDVSKWRIADVHRYEDARRADGVAGTTIQREMSLMRAALNHAKKRERLDRVPHFERVQGEPRKRRPLSEEEFARLMKAFMPRRIRMFFLLAFWTGHRSRAIEELTWDRVNLEERTIDFNVPGVRRTSKRRVDGFPIPTQLQPRLVAAKEYADKFLPNDPYVIGLGPRGIASTTYHACKIALRSIGINEPGLCRHTLRKTFVTTRIIAGRDPEKVAALIGDDAGTMRRNYLFLRTRDLREAAELH